MFSSLKKGLEDGDNILMLIRLGIAVCVVFMGFQFIEFRQAMETEGCRYYYNEYVGGAPGDSDYSEGIFVNSSELEKLKERNEMSPGERALEDYDSSSGLPAFNTS